MAASARLAVVPGLKAEMATAVETAGRVQEYNQ
jgi:hypothetical protein